MNKAVAKSMFENFKQLKQSEQKMDAIEAEFDHEISYDTYLYKGFIVHVSNFSMYNNFVVINSCNEKAISEDGLHTDVTLTIEQFIDECVQ